MNDNVNRGSKELCPNFEASTSLDSIELLHCSRYPEEALYEIRRLRAKIESLKARNENLERVREICVRFIKNPSEALRQALAACEKEDSHE
jgi:ferredoxin-NADP reductase